MANSAFNDYDFDSDSSKKSTLTNEQVNYNIIDETKQERQENQIEKEVFDVAILGAGFSGLSAVLLLGRYLRQTVIFDVGVTRNVLTKIVGTANPIIAKNNIED